MLKRALRRSIMAAGFAVAATLLALVLQRVGVVHDLLDAFERRTLDYRMARYRGPAYPAGVTPSDPVIVDIDDASLEELGRFPRWPRGDHARLIDTLTAAGARVIALDLLFPEPDRLPERVIRRRLRAAAPRDTAAIHRALLALDDDSTLAAAMRRSGRVILGAAVEGDTLALPTPRLRDAALGIGHVHLDPDPDGVTRHLRAATVDRDSLVPAFAIRAALAALELPATGLRLEDDALTGPGWRIPVDPNGDILLDLVGPARTFLRVAYADALNGRASHALFQDRVVLVGATASGLMDMFSTAFPAAMPGVELHANVVHDVLAGRFPARAAFLADALGAFLLALATALLVLWLRPSLALPLALLALAVYVVGAFEVFAGAGTWASVTFPGLAWGLAALGTAGYRYGAEARSRLAIKRAFSRYLAPDIVDRIALAPGSLELGGAEREVTVGFMDIRGFTALSESLSPEGLTAFLNAYFTTVTDIVLEHGGLVDKYIGDAVMVVFGAPNRLEDHAARACAAGLAIRDAVEGAADRWAALGVPSLRVGLGLNTGVAVVGNMGSDHRFDYTALGDVVNTASRIEGLNGALDTTLLVGEATRDAAPGFVFREMGRHTLKGKREPVAVFELVGRTGTTETEQP